MLEFDINKITDVYAAGKSDAKLGVDIFWSDDDVAREFGTDYARFYWAGASDYRALSRALRLP